MILVAGATGALGGMITRRLLDRGEPVRILVRQGSDFRTLADQGAQPVFGDLKDPASLKQAVQGVETVITTANSAARGGEDDPQSVDWQGNRNLVDAAKEAGVGHFIYISALPADAASEDPFLRAKGQTAEYLRDSGVPYTILAPNLFMESWIAMIVGMPLQAGQPITLVGEGRRKHTFISAEDVADFAVAAVNHPEAKNRYIPLGGPEALSWRDVVAAHERALGREVPVRWIEPGEPLPGLPDMVTGLMAALEMFDTPLPMEEAARTFGVSLTSVDEYVRRTVPAESAAAR